MIPYPNKKVKKDINYWLEKQELNFEFIAENFIL